MIWALINTVLIIIIGVVVYVSIPRVACRVGIVLLFVVLVCVNFAGMVESLGQPKPYALEWRNLKGEEIVGLQWAEKSVYAWVNIDGVPRGYEFPMPKDAKETEELQGQYEGRSRSGAQFYVSGGGDVADVEMPPPAPVKDGSPTMEIPE